MKILRSEPCIFPDNKMTITAGDDGIHASGDLIIDSGTYEVTESVEGLEGKSITINGGDITIYATDDGVNAANANANQDEIFFTMNGGTLNVEVGQGDTDPIDSNGNITVTGGTIKLTGQSDSTLMVLLPTLVETSISTVKNKRKLSTPCLEAVGDSRRWRTSRRWT